MITILIAKIKKTFPYMIIMHLHLAASCRLARYEIFSPVKTPLLKQCFRLRHEAIVRDWWATCRLGPSMVLEHHRAQTCGRLLAPGVLPWRPCNSRARIRSPCSRRTFSCSARSFSAAFLAMSSWRARKLSMVSCDAVCPKTHQGRFVAQISWSSLLFGIDISLAEPKNRSWIKT